MIAHLDGLVVETWAKAEPICARYRQAGDHDGERAYREKVARSLLYVERERARLRDALATYSATTRITGEQGSPNKREER